jgi:hypothetical protein
MTTQTILTVSDHGERVAIAFDDILKYHGRHSIGGVAHGFKVMERAFDVLAPEQPLDRYEVTIETAFPGPGARDAFEFVVHAVTGGRYTLVPELDAPDAVQAPTGRYCFRMGYQGETVELALKEGFVHEEFIALARAGARTEDDKARLKRLKQEMTDRLLARPANEVYDVAG